MPYDLRMFHMTALSIESKALEKSTKVVTKGRCLSRAPSIILRNVCICSMQLIPFRKPAWFGLSFTVDIIIYAIEKHSVVDFGSHRHYSKYSPILMYGIDAIATDKKVGDNLANVHNSIFTKLFGTFDKQIIERYHYFTGYLIFLDSSALKRMQFLCKLCESRHGSPAQYMFYWFG